MDELRAMMAQMQERLEALQKQKDKKSKRNGKAAAAPVAEAEPETVDQPRKKKVKPIEIPEEAPLPENSNDTAVTLDLTFRHPGETRSINNNQVLLRKAGQKKTDAVEASQGDRARATVVLFKHQAHIDIKTFEIRLRKRLQADYALPSYLRGKGVYRVPVVAVPELQDILEQARQEHSDLVEAACKPGTWKEMREQDQEELNRLNLWESIEPTYPTRDAFKQGFFMDWFFLETGTAKALKKVSTEFYKQEAERGRERARQDIDYMRAGLRGSFKEYVDKLCEILGGNQKQFKYTSIEKLQNFISVFDRANTVVQDNQLEVLIGSAREMLAGKNPRELADLYRDNYDARAETSASMARVQTALDKLVEDKPIRMFSFD